MSLHCVLLRVEELLLQLESASALACSFFSRISLPSVSASEESDVSKATSSTLPSSRQNLMSPLAVDLEERSTPLSVSFSPSVPDNAYHSIIVCYVLYIHYMYAHTYVHTTLVYLAVHIICTHLQSFVQKG